MSIRERRENVWEINIDLGNDPATGRRRRAFHTFRGTMREAQSEERRLLVARDAGTYVAPSALKVGEFLNDWLKAHEVGGNISHRTAQGYADMLRLHIAPSLGDIKLGKLQPKHLQDFYTKELESGRVPKPEKSKKSEDGKEAPQDRQSTEPKPEDKRLAPQTVLHFHRLLHEALKYAVMAGYIAVNPADRVTPPKVRRHETSIVDKNQTLALIAAARGTRLHIPIVLAVGTGARRGEILALRWTDCDLKAGTITIRRTLSETREHGIIFKEPKSRQSVRTITLTQFALAALKEHKKAQAEEIMANRPIYQDNGLVVPNSDGRPWKPSLLTGAFGDFMNKLDLPRIRFHDLRHGSLSMLILANVPPKVVSARAGHSTIGITMDVYGHLLPGADAEAASRLDTFLEPDTPAEAEEEVSK